MTSVMKGRPLWPSEIGMMTQPFIVWVMSFQGQNVMCRETGMMTELSSVPVHSLVPEPLQSIASADEFMARLPEFDGLMAQQLDEATAAGDCLRFVGRYQLTVPEMQSTRLKAVSPRLLMQSRVPVTY